MTKKIALLRGINVGGHRKIKMAALRTMFTQMEFLAVKTYIQSGNVIFDVPIDTEDVKLSQQIEAKILDTFGHDVPVIIVPAEVLKNAIVHNPYLDGETDTKTLHLTFLSEAASKNRINQIEALDYRPDQFVIQHRIVFLYIGGKFHQSKLSNAFFEKHLQVKATTRNWKTVLKLYELSQA